MPEDKNLIGQVLIRQEVITKAQLTEVLTRQKTEKMRLGELLVKMDLATQREIAQALAMQAGIRFVDLEAISIAPPLLEKVPQSIATKHNIIPIEMVDNRLVVAAAESLDFNTIDNLRFILNCEVEYVLTGREALSEAISRYYGGAEESVDTLLSEFTDTMDDVSSSVLGAASQAAQEKDDAPIVRLVQAIITEAIARRSSDIHVEPMKDRLRIRYRIDGVCHEVEGPQKRLQSAILSRLKIMSGMDIAEKRKPQDGRIQLRVGDKDLDFRASALPSTNGESFVLRILDKESVRVNLEQLGFHPDDFAKFQRIIKRPNGIFLVTGPTGSGKTTTLYSALNALNRPDVKIITAEEPVEYNLAGINQVEVNRKIGLTFSHILRAVLRQAPNIILVGEIRDSETAEIAIQAALTGHLVFSTLHTNDAPGAITRLIDMGVAPYLAASSIQAVMGQRLLRILCEKCKEACEPDPTDMRLLNVDPADYTGKTIYKAVGCKDCSAGYKGRMGAFELMEMNAAIRELAFNKAPTIAIRKQARASGMLTLQEDGVRKIFMGTTSVAEVMRTTQRESVTKELLAKEAYTESVV